jgi:5-methylcytosine-specific restriction endonuclease McrA
MGNMPWINEGESAEFLAFRRKVYNSKGWKQVRAYILGLNPFCSECKNNYALDVDHINPLHEIYLKGGDPFDPENLRGLCKQCHGKKSHTEGIGKRKQIKKTWRDKR